MELIDELKQLSKEWQAQSERRTYSQVDEAASRVFKVCADQLKTIIEAHNES